MSLKAYIDQRNKWAELSRGQVALDINRLTPGQVAWIRDDIHTQLSPENLTCDGELDVNEVNERYAFLQQVLKDLAAL